MSEAGEIEDRLYGLLEVAERQQAAVQAALDGLAGGRTALEGERARLAREVTLLDLSLRAAVKAAVNDGLASAATEGAKAVEAATAPLLGELAAVTERAGRAEPVPGARLTRAARNPPRGRRERRAGDRTRPAGVARPRIRGRMPQGSPTTLAGSRSPFLRHGAEQPVAWLPWGAEAFERAQREAHDERGQDAEHD